VTESTTPERPADERPARRRPELPAISAMYEAFVASLPRLTNLPRAHRFTLGERLEKLQMDVLEALVRARYAKTKADLLSSANVSLELCRLLVRALCDTRQVSVGLYEKWILELDDVGKQVGGWLKHAASKEAGGDGAHA